MVEGLWVAVVVHAVEKLAEVGYCSGCLLQSGLYCDACGGGGGGGGCVTGAGAGVMQGVQGGDEEGEEGGAEGFHCYRDDVEPGFVGRAGEGV